jgi:hypothetical protein
MLMNVVCFAFLYVSMFRVLLSAACMSEVSLAQDFASLADQCSDVEYGALIERRFPGYRISFTPSHGAGVSAAP